MSTAPKETSQSSPLQVWLSRLILFAIVFFVLYLLFGDEDHTTRNLIRAAIRGISKAL